MLTIPVSLVIMFYALAVFAGLKSDLTSAKITAVFPGDSNYTSASTPCKSLLFIWRATLTIFTVNLRFSFQPATITYPQTIQDVSTIIKLGATYNLKVAARSGGVSLG
jgi:FAD/FMN-containing dehydrogenase